MEEWRKESSKEEKSLSKVEELGDGGRIWGR